MSQSAGSRLGPYVVGGLITAGSSGEWFDGSEVSLERPVSVLVVPLPQDAESAATLRERARGRASLTDAQAPARLRPGRGWHAAVARDPQAGRPSAERDRPARARSCGPPRLPARGAASRPGRERSLAGGDPGRERDARGSCRRRTSLAASGPARRGLGRRVLGDEVARLASRQPRRRPAPRRPTVRPSRRSRTSLLGCRPRRHAPAGSSFSALRWSSPCCSSPSSRWWR